MSDYANIETKWQERWEEDGIFEADPDPSKPKFFMTVPYPYTNGALHIGHGRTYTVGDLIARYKRMRGYNVLFPMASHMTGTPILGMCERIKEGDPDAIEQYKRDLRLYLDSEEEVEEQIQEFTDPWTTAKFFADVIHKDFKRLGYGIDWRRKFTTGDNIYNKFVSWQYHKLMDEGYIRKGSHPLLYCPNCGNPVGEDDLLEGETAKIKEFTAIKFGFEDGYLVPATLRPETVFGVTNMWINPNATYVWAKVDGEKWVVSKDAAEKMRLQDKDIEIIKTFPGSEIVGKNAQAVHDDHDIPILPADFVNPTNATGVVYSVPGHAPFDYVALKDLWETPSSLEEYGISAEDIRAVKPISMIEIEGYSKLPAKDAVEKHGIESQKEAEHLEEVTQEVYKAEFYDGIMKDNCEQFSGRPIKEVKEDVINWMKSNNRADAFYEPDQRPVVCKCGSDVQVAVLAGQWFLDYESPGWKKQAWKALNEMCILPETFRNLFEATFDWLAQRPCARKRGIGTELPFDDEWIIEALSDSTIYMAFYTIVNTIKEESLDAEQLTVGFFDYVYLGEGDKNEISEETGVPVHLMDEMREEFLYWYPNDQRHTAPSHISNHLSFAIFHHVAIFPEKHWLQCISLNEHVIMEGSKMSKSKGNVIPLVEIPKKYGADVYRIYAISAAEPGSLMDWRESDVPAVKNRLRQFQDIIDRFGGRGAVEFETTEDLTTPTRWLLSKVNSAVANCGEYIDSLKLRDYAIHVTSDMIRTVNEYLNRSEVPTEERNKAMEYVADLWVRLIAPLAPHAAEEMWEKMGHDDYVSLALWPEADNNLIDSLAEQAHGIVKRAIDDVKEIMKLLKDETPEQVHLYVSPQWKFDALDSVEKADLPIVTGKIMGHLMSQDQFRKHGGDVKKLVDRIVKENGLWDYSPSAEQELAVFKDTEDYMSAALDLEVQVYDAGNPDYDPKGKAEYALPGRPSLYLE
ncbi:MAG: leucine--tRNA ligase [Candidatus Thorarchaeota archaeon]